MGTVHLAFASGIRDRSLTERLDTHPQNDIRIQVEDAIIPTQFCANEKQQMSRGYCTPWGNDGGDLCREWPTNPHCSDVDKSDFYHNFAGSHFSEAHRKCTEIGPLCQGFTWNMVTDRYKLKSAINGMNANIVVREHRYAGELRREGHPGWKYHCYRKIPDAPHLQNDSHKWWDFYIMAYTCA